MTGDCAAFDAEAAAATLAANLNLGLGQITVVKNCGDERRRRLESGFTVDLEVVQGHGGVTEQSVAVATRLHDVLVPDLVVHGARPHGEEAAARGGAARGAERSSQH